MKHKVRYMTVRTDKNGIRYYWQPSATLRKAGFKLARLSDDYTVARAEAQKLNEDVDTWSKSGNTDFKFRERIHPESFAALVLEYRNSSKWMKLAPKTQRSYDQCLKIISETFGNKIVRLIDRAAVLRFYEREFARKHSVANACMRVFRRVLQFAVNYGWIKINPAARPELIPLKQRYSVWPKEAEEAYIETALKEGRTSIAAAVLLAANLGQREGDILRLGWSDFNGKAFRLRQSKTKVLIEVPARTSLLDFLSKMDKTTQTIVVNENSGLPFKEDHFRKIFRKIKFIAAKKYPHIDFSNLWYMDLRRTAVVRMGEVGATEAEISAVTGHKIESCRQILEVYLPRNSKMARHAIRKLEFAA